MGLRESEEKLKQQQQEAARRENILVMRLATKEQEMQECTVSMVMWCSVSEVHWFDFSKPCVKIVTNQDTTVGK